MQRIKSFIQFDEAYAEFILEICRELRRQLACNIEFFGIATRRETVRKKLDPVTEEIGLVSYEWWNNVEMAIVASALDQERLAFFRDTLGDDKLRKLVCCCREVGVGLISGGGYARTKLRSYVEASDENRWNYIVGVLDYYLTLFSREKPDFVFFNEVSFPWELGACFIAEYLGIPCYVLTYVRSGGGYLIDDNPYQRCKMIEERLCQRLELSLFDDEVYQKALQEVEAYRLKPTSPEYMVENKKKVRFQSSVWGLFRTLATDLGKCAVMHLGLFGTKGFLRQENWWDITFLNIRCFVSSRLALADVGFESALSFRDCRYIYYPLHVEPEASTMVLSEKLTNQLFFIEQISKSMPVGFKLLVKEHAPMLGRRPSGFYKRIRNLPNVHLISPFADNFSLIRSAELVCVLTGTAGWEAIQLGVPVLAVGEAQYLGIGEGYIRCTNLFDMSEYIEAALVLDPVSLKRVASFVAASRELQTDVTPRSVAYWHYGLSPEEAISRTGVVQLAEQIIEKAGI
jgi:hypothetical protein